LNRRNGHADPEYNTPGDSASDIDPLLFWRVSVKRVLAVFVSLVNALHAMGAPPPEEKTGLKVGEKAPEFKLKDQSGKERELRAMRKDGPVALVFYRSASW
jgi:AhpC/TSA family